jgi:dTDP-4-dehydrorhamnose reductase
VKFPITNFTVSFSNSPRPFVKVGVTGPNGRLAKTLLRLDSSIIPLYGDICDPSFSTGSCTIIINCAAKTDVCEAQRSPSATFQSNVQGPYNLAHICVDKNIHLIHISTDHVFGQSIGAPFKETDVPEPHGVYAETKLLGEFAIEAMMDKPGTREKHTIIRTSLMNGFQFNKAFIDKYWSGDVIDSIACEILIAVRILQDKGKLPPLLHIGTGRKSIYDVARRLKPGVEKQYLSDNPTNKVGLSYLRDSSLDSTLWEATKRK